MQQAVKHGADSGNIAQQFAPVPDRTVGCEQCAEAFVAARMISSKSSAAVCGSLRISKSSMMSSGMVATDLLSRQSNDAPRSEW
jgi:hypothetical protein